VTAFMSMLQASGVKELRVGALTPLAVPKEARLPVRLPGDDLDIDGRMPGDNVAFAVMAVVPGMP
jgi:hypothetical protein